ncbi:MAG: BON domain-containing protein [Legionellales bacterium]
MKKQVCFLLVTSWLGLLITGCLGSAWTGASLLYDRHDVYSELNDYKLSATAGHLLASDKLFERSGCKLDLAVFHGTVLLAGHVTSKELRQIALDRLHSLSGYRLIYNQLAVTSGTSSTAIFDSWITTKIRSKIFADASIAPKDFKIVTVDGIVYIMGDIRKDQAEQIITIARNTDRVIRVVKLFRILTESKG